MTVQKWNLYIELWFEPTQMQVIIYINNKLAQSTSYVFWPKHKLSAVYHT